MPACPPRGPFEPSHCTGGGASASPYAVPFEQETLPLVDSAPRLVGSQLSEAWGTGVVVASCDDVPTSADFRTVIRLPPQTAAWEGLPVASAEAWSCVAGAVGGKPGPETSFSAACAAACSVQCLDTTLHLHTGAVLPSSAVRPLGSRSWGVSLYLD